jgi:hypothetical protein
VIREFHFYLRGHMSEPSGHTQSFEDESLDLILGNSEEESEEGEESEVEKEEEKEEEKPC